MHAQVLELSSGGKHGNGGPYSAPRRKAKRRHFVLCELSRLLLELNATHIHIFESVYKRARNISRPRTKKDTFMSHAAIQQNTLLIHE